MRTKALICAAALAAGAISAMADNVYSLNVVGYVNVTLPGNGYSTIVNNVLNNANNNLSNLFPAAAMKDGCTIYKWNPAAADWDGTFATFYADPGMWDTDWEIAPGEAVFFTNPDGENITATLVGDVVQNNVYTRTLAGNGQQNLIGSSVPLAGSFVNSLVGLTPSDGDTIYVWDNTVADWNGTFATYYSDPGMWDTDFEISVGQGFLYGANGEDPISWSRAFTIAP